MHKKILLLLTILIIAFVTSGCIKSSTRIEITKNDKVILSQVQGISINLLKMADPEFDVNNPFKNWEENKDDESVRKLKKLQKQGFRVSDYKDENFVGKKIEKEYRKAQFLPPDELPEGFMMTTSVNHPVEIKKSPFGTKYKVSLKFDPKKIEETNEKYSNMQQSQAAKEEQNPDEQMQNQQAAGDIQVNVDAESEKNMQNTTQTIAEMPEMKPVFELVIKIPKKAKAHNATSFDKKTHEYYWDFANMEEIKNKKPVEITLEYEKTNFLSIIFLILIIAATIHVVNKNKNYSQKQTDENLDAF